MNPAVTLSFRRALAACCLFAAFAGMAWFFWKRGVLGTIVCGTAVYLPLRLLLGW